jgi:methyl-accepting chemotaxis protein
MLASVAGALAAAAVAQLVSSLDAGTAVVALAAMAAVLATQAALAPRAGDAGADDDAPPAAARQQVAAQAVDSRPEPAAVSAMSQQVAARLDELAPFFALTDAQLRSIAEQTGEAALGILAQLRDLDGQLTAMKAKSRASHERGNRISAEGLATDHNVVELIRGYMKARSEEIAAERVHLSRVIEQMNSLKDLTHSLDQIGSATNILSLNATIEAERAGALGAGFKVVAGEIRALSQKSRAAVQEANSAIAATQSVIETTLLGASTDQRRAVEARQIEQVLSQLDAVSNSYSAIVAEHDTLMTEMDAEHAAIAHSVMDTFGRIQFQDVVRQQVEALVEALEELKGVLGSFSQGLAGDERADLTRGRTLIEQLQSRYVSNVQRSTHAAALGEAARLDNAKAIELF